jgi:hypothetical protein
MGGNFDLGGIERLTVRLTRLTPALGSSGGRQRTPTVRLTRLNPALGSSGGRQRIPTDEESLEGPEVNVSGQNLIKLEG